MATVIHSIITVMGSIIISFQRNHTSLTSLLLYTIKIKSRQLQVILDYSYKSLIDFLNESFKL